MELAINGASTSRSTSRTSFDGQDAKPAALISSEETDAAAARAFLQQEKDYAMEPHCQSDGTRNTTATRFWKHPQRDGVSGKCSD
jgi:hypothetical protein